MKCLAAVLFLMLFALPARAETQRLIELSGRPGTSFHMILVEPEAPPRAAVLLFTGGTGSLRLWEPRGLPLAQQFAKGNFLIRTRALFAGHGFRVGAPDVPSDRREQGMSAAFRRSAEHEADVEAAIRALKGDENLPVWLVGTSMGTFSAAAMGLRLADQVVGLVLTSSITRGTFRGRIPIEEAGGIRDFDLGGFAKPVFVLAHKDDTCFATPPGDAKDLVGRFRASPRAEAQFLAGGRPAESIACEALAAHGFWGVETEAVAAIAAFIHQAGGATR